MVSVMWCVLLCGATLCTATVDPLIKMLGDEFVKTSPQATEFTITKFALETASWLMKTGLWRLGRREKGDGEG